MFTNKLFLIQKLILPFSFESLTKMNLRYIKEQRNLDQISSIPIVKNTIQEIPETITESISSAQIKPKSFYRRPFPETLISFTSEQGHININN